MDEEMTTNGPTTGLEQKIERLAAIVDKRLGSLEEKVGRLDEKVERLDVKVGSLDTKANNLATAMAEGFKQVDDRFTKVDQQLTDMDQRLRKVHVLAEDTKAFGHNVYDSLATLTKNVEEGFGEAAKDRDEKFEVVRKAILHWGERVKVLEVARTPRATKRRR